MFLGFILFIFGIYLLTRVIFGKKKVIEPSKVENIYIAKHEKKLKDDEAYEEYLEWCKMKGELAEDKEGFDEYRMREYQLYKKLIKHGFSGLK